MKSKFPNINFNWFMVSDLSGDNFIIGPKKGELSVGNLRSVANQIALRAKKLNLILNEKQKQALKKMDEFIKEYGNTGVQRVLNSVVFDILKCIAIFPAGAKMADSKGNVLPDCYLMKEGSTALDFAFRLHSDIGNNFVKAIHIRNKQAVGKDYVLKHRDGLEIMTK